MKILVLCTGNSCRSQMMDGYLKTFLPEGSLVCSAGIETHGLNKSAVAIMAEDGIDISEHTSNHLSEYEDILFDIIVTVCDHAKESCPVFPTESKSIHHNFTDPSKLEGSDEEKHAAFLACRNEIKAFALELSISH